MNNILFPVELKFTIGTLANDFEATDANGSTLAYVHQKMFKFKEEIVVYQDSSKANEIFTINADSWLDFSAAYSFKNTKGDEIGKIVRKGWKSIWRSSYQIIDRHGVEQYNIVEENAWVKLMDGFLGGVPVLNIFTGYFFNPSYILSTIDGKAVARLSKIASFWGRKFKISKLGEIGSDDEVNIMLGFMMMVLLERERG